MSLDEKIRRARERPKSGRPRSRDQIEVNLVRIQSELKLLRDLYGGIQQRIREQENGIPWYQTIWRSLSEPIFGPKESLDDMYRKQSQGFHAVRWELKRVLAQTKTDHQRVEQQYQTLLDERQKIAQRTDCIDLYLIDKREAHDQARNGQNNEDIDRLSRFVLGLEYDRQNASADLETVERQRLHLHDVCQQYMELNQTYQRIYQQVSAFEQEAHQLRTENSTLIINNDIATSLFGALDTLIAHVGSLQQSYQDSRQASMQYTHLLLQETESSEQFQEL